MRKDKLSEISMTLDELGVVKSMGESFRIGNIPAILYGEESKGVYLYIHGQHSRKEAAEDFSGIANLRGWQVLAIDLPEHGERKAEQNSFYVWNVVPELKMLLEYAKKHWKHIALRAHSVGAYFSMVCYQKEHFENVQMVGPIVDMKKLYEDMMSWAAVTPEQLEEEKYIQTNFGQTLCWEEYHYAKEYPVNAWNNTTAILFGAMDNFTSIETVQEFTERFSCALSVMENGEHWFHTEEQLAVLREWTKRKTPKL